MFTEALELIDDLEETLTRLKEDSTRINHNLIIIIRNYVIRLIVEKGLAEQIKLVHEHGAFFENLVWASLKLGHDHIIINKIRYFMELFKLVKDGHVYEFFNDLGQGFDYVIGVWDGSDVDPRQHLYRYPPSRIKRKIIYRRKWDY